MNNNILFSSDFGRSIASVLTSKQYDKFFMLIDEKVDGFYFSFLENALLGFDVHFIMVPNGDSSKCIGELERIWTILSNMGASRHSCLINFGGGMVTDLGGFAASTFKRGISFVNVPTTLLAMVDASTGGKTGINFNGLKNEIGAFAQPDAVIIYPEFLRSLDDENLLSGYAEMLKHSLIDSDKLWSRTLNYDILSHYTIDADLLRENICVKERIVNEDPHEKGMRKVLNFGHTFGHAFEELSQMKLNPMLHGYAVAFGMVCELYLSTVMQGFPTEKMRQTVQFIRRYYGEADITCKDYDSLLDLMLHDKKNLCGEINFTLLKDIGMPQINCHAQKEIILEALDFLREGI